MTPAIPDCRSFPDLLDDYLDGDPSLLESLHAHTASCAGCASEMLAAQRILSAVGRGASRTPDPALVDRILSAVDADRNVRRGTRLRWRIAAACVGALAASFAIWLAVRPEGSSLVPTIPVEVVEIERPRDAVARVEPIGDRFGEAGDLLVQLTRRRTTETVVAARTLLPSSTPTLDSLPTDLPDTGELQTAADSVRAVGRNAVLCFEPLTRSAENALSFLRREVIPETEVR